MSSSADPYAAFSRRVDASPPSRQAAPEVDPYAAFSRRADAPDLPRDTGEGPMVLTVRPRPRGETAQGGEAPSQGSGSAEALPGRGSEPVRPSQMESAGRGAKQALLSNFGDELTGAAAAGGIPDFLGMPSPLGAAIGGVRLLAEKVAPSLTGTDASEAYNRAAAAERAANEAAQKENPGSYFAGEMTGALATGLVAPMAAPFKAASGAGAVARGAAGASNLAATGAAYGALGGLGGGEGDLIDRAPSAATGAAVGGVLAPVIGGAIGGARAAGGYLGDHIAATRNPGLLADEMVVRALRRDAPEPAALADAFAAAHEGGQALTLADVAGPNTQAVAGNAARMPGPARAPARQFLEERQLGTEAAAGQGERISDKLGQMLGDQGSIATADQIIARRATRSRPLYKAAHEAKINYTSREGNNLLALLDRVPNLAKAKANDILRVEDKGGHHPIWNPLPDANGNYALSAVPNARHWDYIKRGLDLAIEHATDPVTGKVDTYGHALQGLKAEMLAQLDKAIPGYARARQVFAGHSEMLDALRSGRDVFTPSMTPEAVRKAMAGLSPGEQEMFRLGAANALREKLGNAGDGADKARLAYGNPSIRAKIAAMAPDGKFTKFLKNESDMFKTRGQIGGSPTAERVGDASDIGGQVVEGLSVARDLARGNVPAIMMAAARHLSKVNPEMRGQVLEHARQIVLNPDPAAIRAFVERVNQVPMNEGARKSLIGLVTKALPRAITNQATEDLGRRQAQSARNRGT